MTDREPLSVEKAMPCGCYGVPRQGNTQLTWLVTAEAFLCSEKHKQGDVLVWMANRCPSRGSRRPG